MKLSRFLLYVLLTSWLNLAFASTTTNSTEYKPKVGQEGKDVIWVPTPEGLIDKMLAAAKVNDKDTLFDLGAGDGIIAITATRKYGAKSVGIEYNPEMAQFARRKVAEAGMTDKVKIITGDIFQEDFSAATVVTLYLMPHLNIKLRPILLKMKPGTRVVSNTFSMVMTLNTLLPVWTWIRNRPKTAVRAATAVTRFAGDDITDVICIYGIIISVDADLFMLEQVVHVFAF